MSGELGDRVDLICILTDCTNYMPFSVSSYQITSQNTPPTARCHVVTVWNRTLRRLALRRDSLRRSDHVGTMCISKSYTSRCCMLSTDWKNPCLSTCYRRVWRLGIGF